MIPPLSALPAKPRRIILLRNVRPAPADYQRRNGGLGDAVGPSELGVGHPATGIPLSDGDDLFRRQFVSPPLPALGNLVPCVVVSASQEQMVGPNASGVVAGMTNHVAIWNRAVRQFVSNAVRQLKPTFMAHPAVVKLAGRPLVSIARPLPTPRRFPNVLPETFLMAGR